MKKCIISLGGSVIVPGKIDISYLKKFSNLIISFTKKGYRFGIYCGGGKLARNFQDYGKSLKLSKKNLDWLGIYATRINANFLIAMFGDKTDKKIIIDPTRKIKSRKPILIAGGWKPGWSTDYDAVLLAKNMKISKVINVTNVDYVYDKNPKKCKNAKPIKEISWKEFRKLVGNKWKPGLNMPFDPIAAKEAEKSNIEVVIAGKNLNNLKKIIQGKRFKGTIVR